MYPKLRFKGFDDAWEQRKLRDIVTYKNGKGHENNQSDEGTYELINLNSISIDGGLKSSGKFIEDGNDTLLENDLVMVLSDVGHGDLLGRVAIIPESNRFVLNQRVALLRINDDTNPYFLFSIINSHQDYFKKMGAGSSQLNISRGAVEDFVIDSPWLEEQQRIGQFFKSLDTLITLHQRQCEALKKQKRFFLQNMFPKEGESEPRIRFNGFTEPWEQRKLNEVSDVRDGTHDSPKYQSTGHPFVTSKNVKNGYITYDDIQYISDEDFEEINKRSKVDVNDILMGMIGTIGNMALIRTEPDFAIKNVALIKDTKQINYLYLYHLLQSPFIEKQLTSGMDGGTQKFVSLGNVRNLDIVIPSDAEQDKLGRYFENLDNLITLHQRQYEQLVSLKKYLLSKMFI